MALKQISLILLPICVSLAACDRNAKKLLDLMAGRESKVVVLAQNPVVLKNQILNLTPKEPLEVLGDWTSICFSLRGDVPLQDNKKMEQLISDAMQGAQVKVSLVLSTGERVVLHPPMQAWSMYGNILEKNELSVCSSTPCKSNLPVGTVVSKVEVTADPPLRAMGIYWKSERDLGAKSPPPNTPIVAKQGQRSACAANT